MAYLMTSTQQRAKRAQCRKASQEDSASVVASGKGSGSDQTCLTVCRNYVCCRQAGEVPGASGRTRGTAHALRRGAVQAVQCNTGSTCSTSFGVSGCSALDSVLAAASVTECTAQCVPVLASEAVYESVCACVLTRYTWVVGVLCDEAGASSHWHATL